MKNWMTGVAAAALVLSAGCGKREEPKAQTPASQSGPVWIDTGDDGTLKPGDVTGVGIASGKRSSDRGLKRDAAELNAKQKIASTLQERVSALVKSYQRSVSDLVKDPMEESDISNVARSFTDTTMTGARLKNTWEDKSNGDLYVLMVLPFDQMADSLKKRIDETVAARIKENSAKAHQELDKAIDDVRKNGWPK